jgi:hypothetical protein
MGVEIESILRQSEVVGSRLDRGGAFQVGIEMSISKCNNAPVSFACHRMDKIGARASRSYF